MVNWYCKIDDVEHGPLSQEELVKMAGQGRLSPNDLVRNEKKNKWYKAGAVKGLFSPADEPAGNEQQPVHAGSGTEPSSEGGTSAEAIRLLKGFGKKNRDSQGETRPAPEVTKRPRNDDDWKPAQRGVMQRAEQQPLKPRTKRILGIAAVIVLLLVLFPPHSVPPGYSMPEGWYFTPIFSPPVVSVKADKGVGALDPKNIEIVEENGVQTAYVKSPMPVDMMRLLMLVTGVVVVTAGVLGFLAARESAAGVPDPQPSHPRRRQQA